MSNRTIAGEGALIVIAAIVIIALVFFGGMCAGKGGGGGKSGEKGTGPQPVSGPVLPADRFSVIVEEKTFRVDGEVLDVAEVIRKAKLDGRKVRVFWKRAKNSAESELKRALRDAELTYDETTLE